VKLFTTQTGVIQPCRCALDVAIAAAVDVPVDVLVGVLVGELWLLP
jgi:hypothetical protein